MDKIPINIQPDDNSYQAEKQSLSRAVFLTVRETRKQDQDLIIAAQRDSDAFQKLYEKYRADVYNYFFNHVGNDQNIAEDLTQDTFFRALRYLPNFKTGFASYRTYLLRIAHNLLVNYYREKKPVPLKEAAGIKYKKSGEYQDVIARDNLWQSVEGLSENEKQVINMRYQEELSVREISLFLNKTENAVKLLLSRARSKLRGEEKLK